MELKLYIVDGFPINRASMNQVPYPHTEDNQGLIAAKK